MCHRSASQLRPMMERSMRRLMNRLTHGLCRLTLTKHRRCGSTLPWSRTGRSSATRSSTFIVAYCAWRSAHTSSWTAWLPSTMTQLAMFTSTSLLSTRACIWPASTSRLNPNSWYRFQLLHPWAPTTFAPSSRMATMLSSSAFMHLLHGWSSTARRRYHLPPISTWMKSSRQHHTWSQGRTFQWRPVRSIAHSSPCSPSSLCVLRRLLSRRVQCTCQLVMTSLPMNMLVPAMAGLWSAMMAGTPSSNSSSASQCTGSTCSRGSGTN